MTDADLIWNRACLERGNPRFRYGDGALSSLLMAHGLTMNGGVLHAVELLNDEEFAAAINGYKFFALLDTADLLIRAREIYQRQKDLDEYELKLDQEYAQYIVDDTALVQRFEQHLAAHPEHFAPL